MKKMFRKTTQQIILAGIIGEYILTTISVPVCAQSDAVKEDMVVTNEMNLPANDGTALTEQQVIDLALKYSRKLQSLGTNVAIANHRLSSSGRVENPELRISEVSTRYYADEFDELRVGFRFRLPGLGELGEEKQQARVDFWDRRVEELRYRQEFIAKVRKDYADVLMYDQIAELARKLEDSSGVGMRWLSMGMSHDFEVGIEEGATIVRIGTAIFGKRSKAG